MKNLILSGIPGSGVNKLGCRLADATELGFRDIYDMINASTGMTLLEAYNLVGKAGLAQMESAMCQSLRQTSDTVIAVGDGVALSEANTAALRENGYMVFIEKPMELLNGEELETLPHMRGWREKLPELYARRVDKYRAAADRTVVYTDDDAVLQLLKSITDELQGTVETASGLDELRSSIDDIDRELVKLFSRRLKVCDEIAEVKKRLRLPLTDEAREAEVYDHAIRRVTEDCYEETLGFMKSVIDISKYRQHKTIG